MAAIRTSCGQLRTSRVLLSCLRCYCAALGRWLLLGWLRDLPGRLDGRIKEGHNALIVFYYHVFELMLFVGLGSSQGLSFSLMHQYWALLGITLASLGPVKGVSGPLLDAIGPLLGLYVQASKVNV